jgi:ATP phosphoribosyltransferase regulatory subunit
LFVDGLPQPIGRGGSYAIAHADGKSEPATGFSVFPDRLSSEDC